ncbi:MAG: hypothetical protein Q7U53_13855 [Anaerolineaceae bacterium]|nr:hypothetical protein [Anaerolineaceae bacterium]
MFWSFSDKTGSNAILLRLEGLVGSQGRETRLACSTKYLSKENVMLVTTEGEVGLGKGKAFDP